MARKCVLEILIDEVVVRGFGTPFVGDLEALLLAEIEAATAATDRLPLDHPIQIGTIRVVGSDERLDDAVRRAAQAVAAAIAGPERPS